MTVYVLTAGKYSDYHIKGVFLDETLAEEAKELVPDSNIEEYEPDVIPVHPSGHTAWTVNIVDGTIQRSFQEDCFNTWRKFEPSVQSVQRVTESELNVHCWAKDEKHAKRIALDEYNQWKKEKKFNNPYWSNRE